MSIATLSTELDTKITTHLQGHLDALETMSRVSKYYRGLAEPFLYRDLAFRVVDEVRIKCLLMTLLDRPALAEYIRTFAIAGWILRPSYGINPSYWKTLNALASRLWTYNNAIGKAVFTLPLPASTATSVFGSIYMRGGTALQYVPSIDGVVALLLCMATNIEAIYLAMSGPDYFHLTREVLNGPWTHANGAELLAGCRTPFRKLKSLHFQGHGSSYYPGLALSVNGVTPRLVIKHLRVYGTGNAMGSPNALRVLELRDVNISPAAVESLIHFCTFPNLTYLALESLRNDLKQWTTYDYSRLSSLLIKHTPQLETLECSHVQDVISSPRPFASLKQLTKLHTLRVDIRVLLDTGLANMYIDGDDMLPKSLKHLIVIMSSPRQVHKLLEDAQETGLDTLLTDPIRSIALEVFTVLVDMRHAHLPSVIKKIMAFRDTTINRLKSFIERASRRGLIYRVYGWDDRETAGESPCKYLLGPRFDCTRPYYEDQVTW
jgi:hypothetical protein